MKQKTIAILGATGSIGTQALDLVRRYPDRFSAVCLTANSSSEKLFALVREFRPRAAGMVREPEAIPEDLRFCQWFFGPDCSVEVLKAVHPDAALCAITGIAGLDAVWTALDVCSQVLLANKEALVTGGHLVTEKAKRLHRALLPVDSEHSAIYQCLQAARGNVPSRLILTCSGGALREFPRERLANATVSDVLKHPTWRMGSKITVDCATLMNKGLEVIEAMRLYRLPLSQVEVLIHRQSIVHSLVEFRDGAVLAQLGTPDMRLPIRYALTWPQRAESFLPPLDLLSCPPLTFAAPDRESFPCLALAEGAARRGGTACAILNGANEAAVGHFLRREIGFPDIPRLVAAALERVPARDDPDLEDILAADAAARRAVEAEILKGVQ